MHCVNDSVLSYFTIMHVTSIAKEFKLKVIIIFAQQTEQQCHYLIPPYNEIPITVHVDACTKFYDEKSFSSTNKQ